MRAQICFAAFGMVPVAMAGVIPRGATPPPGWDQPGYDPSAPVYGNNEQTKSPSYNPPSYPNQDASSAVQWTHEAKGTQPGHEWPTTDNANTNSNNNKPQEWTNLPSHPAKGTQQGHEWYPAPGEPGAPPKSPSVPSHPAKGTQEGHEWYPAPGEPGAPPKSPSNNPPSRPPPAAFDGSASEGAKSNNDKSPSWNPPNNVDPDAMKQSGGLEQTEQTGQGDRDAFGNVLKMVDFSGPQKPKCQNPEQSGTLRMNPDKIKSAVNIFCEELIENKTILKDGGRGVKPVKAKGKGAVENDGVINMSVMYHKASCPRDRSRDSVDFSKISKNWCVSHVADLLLDSCQDKSNKEFSALGGAYAMDCMLISVVGQAA